VKGREWITSQNRMKQNGMETKENETNREEERYGSDEKVL
jgi:hypothetical protein